MAEFHDENTLFKVREIMQGQEGDSVLLAADVAEDIIRRLQNAGILFRELETAEQASKRIIEEVTSRTDTEIELLPLVSKDESIRLDCLQMATQTIPLNRTGNEEQFIERARYFEQYVRNGAFEENNNG